MIAWMAQISCNGSSSHKRQGQKCQIYICSSLTRYGHYNTNSFGTDNNRFRYASSRKDKSNTAEVTYRIVTSDPGIYTGKANNRLRQKENLSSQLWSHHLWSPLKLKHQNPIAIARIRHARLMLPCEEQ